MLQNCSPQKNCRRILPASRVSLAVMMAASSRWVPVSVTCFLPPSGTHGEQEDQSQPLPMQSLTGICVVEFFPPINASLRTFPARIHTDHLSGVGQDKLLWEEHTSFPTDTELDLGTCFDQ